MDRFVYVAAAGAKDAMLQQAVNAHNLANAPTIGFKADLIESESLYLRGAGRETRAYKRVREIAADFSGGPLTRTGRALDIAIAGAGWIAVAAICASTNSASCSTARARSCSAITAPWRCRPSAR